MKNFVTRISIISSILSIIPFKSTYGSGSYPVPYTSLMNPILVYDQLSNQINTRQQGNIRGIELENGPGNVEATEDDPDMEQVENVSNPLSSSDTLSPPKAMFDTDLDVPIAKGYTQTYDIDYQCGKPLYAHTIGMSHGSSSKNLKVFRLLMERDSCSLKMVTSQIKAYINTDWVGFLVDRRSMTGYCSFVGGNLIIWRSKKQAVMARSNAEVEFWVFAGAKPLLDKTLGILVEGLIDTFLSLFHENKTKDLRSLDANGFCQLMLELEYFETILHPYLTQDASESLKSLQGVLLEKATESVTESVENLGHHRRSTRGSEDALADDRQQVMSVSPDDLIALAQQFSSELLQAELERTRINTACFVESIPLDMVPEPAKAAYASFRDQ
ncbi:Exocyst complex component SEC5B [Vitis vinifera]|uniref:Exocyst complex component SEC5 n=1 Tax=Vitis vinifera TaxID=29760 RepID=A0A438JVV5_VITVI|nr:Exocyst complex component SEC5B [Vitis vinifera]